MKYIRKTNEDIKDNYSIKLLLDRGIITDVQDTDWYFNPTVKNYCDPLTLDHMEEGCLLLLKHLKNGSKIRLYVDCDVDGFTSSALFINYFNDNLKNRYPNVEITYHIPEGKEHGLRSVMNDFEGPKCCDLIILPDSSSNDYNEHTKLKELGYDILVLDHHDAEKYSENAVVINNQLSQHYENKALSGVGVVYKFLQYFELLEWDSSEESKLEEAYFEP